MKSGTEILCRLKVEAYKIQSESWRKTFRLSRKSISLFTLSCMHKATLTLCSLPLRAKILLQLEMMRPDFDVYRAMNLLKVSQHLLYS